MKPIIKWAGGKRQLINEIMNYFPENYNEYYEPFVGGGAIVFHLEPNKAYINDLNNELMNMYKQIKIRPQKLIEQLKIHSFNHSKEYFYAIRKLDRNNETYDQLSDLEKAARFIYLNKTCFNGLCRFNKNNEFNAPMGSYKKPLICDDEHIRAMSQYFHDSHIQFYNKDFEKFLKLPSKGDFVYLDPPYDPLSQTASFTGYQGSGFGKEEQIRLKKVCDELNERGVKFMQSNSDTDFINELYKDYKIIKVKAKRSINSKGNKRTSINEVLIINY